MNKYKEALETIAMIHGVDGLVSQFLDLKELVEKATPKKIIVSDKEKLFCPNCMTNYRIMTFSGECAPNFENPFCGKCGQALDWSDERW